MSDLTTQASQNQKTITPEKAAAAIPPPSIPAAEIDMPLSLATTADPDHAVLTLNEIPSSLNFYGNNPHVFPPHVSVDLRQNEGEVFSEGQQVGTYKFYAITNDRGEPRSILKIRLDSTSTNPVVADTHYFMVNGDRTSFQFFGSTLANGQADLDTSNPVWKNLAKFYDNPLSLNSEEYHNLTNLYWQRTGVIGNANPFYGSSPFEATFAEAYIHRLLDGLAASPGFVFPNGVSESYIDLIAFSIDEELPSDRRQAIAEHLASVWDLLSPGVQQNFLFRLQNGNAETLNLLGDLALRFLEKTSNPTERSYGFSSVSPLFSSVILNFNASTALKTRILDFLFDSPPNATTGLYSLQNMILDGGPVAFEYPQLSQKISDYLKTALDQAQTVYHLRTLLQDFGPYLPASMAPWIEAEMDKAIAVYDGTFQGSSLLLLGMTSPLVSAAKKMQIEAVIAAKGFSQWVTTPGYLSISVDPPVVFSPALMTRLADEVGDLLVQRLKSTGITDLWRSDYTFAFQGFLKIFGKNPAWEQAMTNFLPALPLLNPKHASETESQYAVRIAKIRKIFLEQRMLVNDPDATTFSKPENLDVIKSYAQNHQDWLYIVCLTPKEVNAKPSYYMVEANPQYFDTPSKLAAVLVHESMHARVEFQKGPSIREIQALIQTWFYEPHEDFHSFVSPYSAANNREYIAEVVQEWTLNGKSQMQKAVSEYGDGNPALLSLFIETWDFQTPLPSPAAGFRPLFSIDQTTGLTVREDVPAKWNGNKKNGVFTFEIDKTNYVVTYRDHKIVSVTSANTAADHLASVLRSNAAQTTAYNLLFSQTLSASQNISLGQREALVKIVKQADYNETVFLQNMARAAGLLSELQKPANAAKLTVYNNFYNRDRPIPSSGPANADSNASLFKNVATPNYNESMFLGSLLKAQELLTQISLSESLRYDFARLSYDPRKILSIQLSYFTADLLMETVNLGYSVQDFLTLLPAAANLLVTMRSPSNADKLASAAGLYGLSISGTEISGPSRKLMLDFVSAPGYNQIDFLNRLAPAYSLLQELRRPENASRLSLYNYFSTSNPVPASGNLSAASAQPLLNIVGASGYNQTAFLNQLAPNPALDSLYTALKNNASALAAYNLLFNQTLNASQIQNLAQRSFLANAISSQKNYSETVFIQTPLKAQTLLQTLRLPANADKAAWFNAAYNFSPTADVSSGLQAALFSVVTAPSYSLENFLVQLKVGSLILELRASPESQTALAKFYGRAVPLQGLTDADRTSLLAFISPSAAFDAKIYLRTVVSAYGLLSAVTAPSYLQAFNDFLGTRLTASASYVPTQTERTIFFNLVNEAGYNKTNFLTVLLRANDLFSAIPSERKARLAFEGLYGENLLSNKAAAKTALFSLASVTSNFSVAQTLNYLTAADSLLTELRRKRNADELQAFNRIYVTSLLSSGIPTRADVQKLLTLVSTPGYREKQILNSL